jgi:hypothetical protein
MAICPAGPPKLMNPSFSQKRSASENGIGVFSSASSGRGPPA